MTGQTLVYCTECAKVYSARKRDDGTFIQYTDTGRCECDNDTFRECGDR